MNVEKIKILSDQCCALIYFRDRCAWEEADFTVGDCSLGDAASRRVNSSIQGVIKAEIEKIQTEIKKAVGV